MDGLLGVAGMIIDSYCGLFPHSRSTSKNVIDLSNSEFHSCKFKADICQDLQISVNTPKLLNSLLKIVLSGAP